MKYSLYCFRDKSGNPLSGKRKQRAEVLWLAVAALAALFVWALAWWVLDVFPASALGIFVVIGLFSWVGHQSQLEITADVLRVRTIFGRYSVKRSDIGKIVVTTMRIKDTLPRNRLQRWLIVLGKDERPLVSIPAGCLSDGDISAVARGLRVETISQDGEHSMNGLRKQYPGVFPYPFQSGPRVLTRKEWGVFVMIVVLVALIAGGIMGALR